MRSREIRWGALLMVLVSGRAAAPEAAQRAGSAAAGVGPAHCRTAVVEGEVHAGQELRMGFAAGLELLLEPVAAGWIVRVIPAHGDRPKEDYAEIATPPYRSVSPLLLSTDFSFRAQDAIGWNPRRFRYAADARAFASLEQMYRKVAGVARPGAADEAALGRLAGEQPEGELQILDAGLTPGTADPTRAAALVSTHFQRTAHHVEQPRGGGTTALGQIEWVKVRARLELPRGARAALTGVKVESSACGGA